MSDSIISSLIASAIWGLLVVFFSPKIIKFLKKMIVSLINLISHLELRFMMKETADYCMY